MTRPFPMAHRSFPVLVALICMGFFAAGCDVMEETIFLDRQAVFEFRFQGDQISPEGEVTTATRIDFQGQLDGFRKDEIINATLVTARLERKAPLRDLNQIFDSATLVLQNGQERTVATQDAMPAQRQAALDVISDNLTSLVRAQNGFTAYLEATASDAIETGPNAPEYRVEVRLTISIEIEGV